MKEFILAGKTIGPGQRCFIIAEAGVNHNGDLTRALELVRRGKESGADCLKFQTFKAERLASFAAPKAAYQLKLTDPDESQLQMLRKLELSESDYKILLQECRNEGLVFLSTPYSIKDAEFLCSLGVPGFKIASGQLNELPLLAAIAKLKLPIILSTGMGTLSEVKEAVATIEANGNPPLIVLQCTTNYPSSIADCNLRAMATLARATGVPIGYSDHTEGINACLAAVALGACVVEKHFTLSRNLPGPDHQSSLEPAELTALVRGIRETEAALGNGEKKPTVSELRNMTGVRRSIATIHDVPAGHLLRESDLQFLRPATGLAPGEWSRVIGRRTRHAVSAGVLLSAQDLV